ncbi:uncharacterized protein BJ171DRAFT_589726 [Polychytrium aggregatum]|uniref:uncharacterized protein n=1 Tax=Polychytrium aggregatum TaxID=110093 RepID=UPI0022FDC4AB|nr:uncharacterized protein BJ171DRAFT_482354 [Polychytrium aggregatum]XP_052961944.1 uncharacterized protein BJ171DRAFT_589726 [Polychytrium aggregatum]KAI9190654.1 hypothetical protein BJ171DRAFT_482354 [Polychytrium aggregatum]KAI9193006.1 hypothetical protein BJ171DRAFT_589726 [Polychytrium aggregatum]
MADSDWIYAAIGFLIAVAIYYVFFKTPAVIENIVGLSGNAIVYQYFIVDCTGISLSTFSIAKNLVGLTAGARGIDPPIKFAIADLDPWRRRHIIMSPTITGAQIPNYNFYITTVGVDWPQNATVVVYSTINGVAHTGVANIRQLPGTTRKVTLSPDNNPSKTTYTYTFGWWP